MNGNDYPQTIETFLSPGFYLTQLVNGGRGPSCFNGSVSIHRYRITAEIIDEPIEVLRERVRQLWRSTRNGHHRAPLRAAAKALGFELDNDEWAVEVKA